VDLPIRFGSGDQNYIPNGLQPRARTWARAAGSVIRARVLQLGAAAVEQPGSTPFSPAARQGVTAAPMRRPFVHPADAPVLGHAGVGRYFSSAMIFSLGGDRWASAVSAVVPGVGAHPVLSKADLNPSSLLLPWMVAGVSVSRAWIRIRFTGLITGEDVGPKRWPPDPRGVPVLVVGTRSADPRGLMVIEQRKPAHGKRPLAGGGPGFGRPWAPVKWQVDAIRSASTVSISCFRKQSGIDSEARL